MTKRAVVFSVKDSAHTVHEFDDVPVDNGLRILEDKLGLLGFVRIDYEDRVLTWESQDGDRNPQAEIGFLAEHFDPSYIVDLVRRTGTNRGAQVAEEIIYGSSDIVARFPTSSLYPNDTSLG